MAKEKKNPKEVSEDFWEETPPSKGMGLFPDEITLTQNIGCASITKSNKITFKKQ